MALLACFLDDPVAVATSFRSSISWSLESHRNTTTEIQWNTCSVNRKSVEFHAAGQSCPSSKLNIRYGAVGTNAFISLASLFSSGAEGIEQEPSRSLLLQCTPGSQSYLFLILSVSRSEFVRWLMRRQIRRIWNDWQQYWQQLTNYEVVTWRTSLPLGKLHVGLDLCFPQLRFLLPLLIINVLRLLCPKWFASRKWEACHAQQQLHQNCRKNMKNGTGTLRILVQLGPLCFVSRNLQDVSDSISTVSHCTIQIGHRSGIQ